MSVESYPRKLVLERRISYSHHRSGWGYAVDSLEPLMLSNGGQGVLLDSMIETNFHRRLAEARANGEVPYRRPWLGIVHVPPEIPAWMDPGKSLCSISRLPVWQESMPYCKGLLVLSAKLGEQVRQVVDLPVLNLKHPTQMPEQKFSIERYVRNPRRRVIQVGWWLRHLCSIQRLPVRSLRRTLLIPHQPGAGLSRFEHAIEGERLSLGLPPLAEWDVDVIPHQANRDYDELLTENMVFLHLHGASASNAVIECIVRHTPVLVNPLPSLIEYLGASYPFYFETLEEAAEKAEDVDLVRETHEYLAALPKESLTAGHFCRSLAESDLYRGL